MNTQEFRKEIAERFLKILEEKPLEWKKGWKDLGRPVNAVTKKVYRGMNFFSLLMLCRTKEYKDYRFATFNQIVEKGWHLKKGAKGTKVEFWFPWNCTQNKKSTWEEYHKNQLNSENKEKITLRAKYFTIFNAADIEGIPPIEIQKEKTIQISEIVKKAAQNMKLPIVNDSVQGPYYNPDKDEVHMPPVENFYNEYEYNSAALHELTHSTGASSRLGRNLDGGFGSESYAYEELVAEIGSCFMGVHIGIDLEREELSEQELKNHEAYVQSWVQCIKEKTEVLTKAIQEAERAADYLEYQAELIPEAEYKKTLGEAAVEDVNTSEEKQTKKTVSENLKKVKESNQVNDLINQEKMKVFQRRRFASLKREMDMLP